MGRSDAKQPFKAFIVCSLLACISGAWLNYYSSRVAAKIQTQQSGSPGQLAVEVNHANLWMLLMLWFGFAAVVFLLRAFSEKRRAIRRSGTTIRIRKDIGTQRYDRAIPRREIAA